MAVSPLNASQVCILKALSEAGPEGLTQSELEQKCSAVVPGNIGPVYAETLEESPSLYSDSLYGRGYVRPYRREDEPTRWKITAAGTTVSQRVRTRKEGIPADQRVPNAILAPKAKAVQSCCTYGIEDWSSDDCQRLRDMLPEQYSHVTDQALIQQARNCRKQGLLGVKKDKVRLAVERTLKAFGPEGDVIEGLLTGKQLDALQALLDAE